MITTQSKADTYTWFHCPECNTHMWLSYPMWIGGKGYCRLWMCSKVGCDYARVSHWNEAHEVALLIGTSHEQQKRIAQAVDAGVRVQVAVHEIKTSDDYREQTQECANLAHGF